MALTLENPCKSSLSSGCFKQFPTFSRQAFAYRLLHMLIPQQITFRLPKILRDPLAWPGPTFPPGWQPGDPIPEGAYIPPGIMFPPGWNFGDPWPEGVIIWPTFIVPGIDWFPPGTVILPGTTLPAGWQPGDPLPDGIIPPPSIPGGAVGTGIPPPIFDLPFLGGSGVWGAGGHMGAAAYLFTDDFSTLDLTEWTITKGVEGTAEIVAGRLHMFKLVDAGLIYIGRTDPDATLTYFTFEFLLKFVSGTTVFHIDYWTGTWHLNIDFQLPNTLQIYDGTQYQQVSVADFTNEDHTWSFHCNAGKVNVYQDGLQVATALDLAPVVNGAGYCRFVLSDTGEIFLDNFKLTGI